MDNLGKKLGRIIHLNLDAYAILGVLFFTVFLIPLFPGEAAESLYDLTLLLIFLWVVWNTRKHRWLILTLVVVALLLRWVLFPFSGQERFSYLAKGINILVFLYGVFQLIFDIARKEEVDSSVIVDAINGYLLLGLALSALIASLHQVEPASFNFASAQDLSMTDYNYFGFVTLTTLGYGDIAPQTPFARSIAILSSVAGQLYLTVIVALLVGKLVARSS